MSHMIPLRQLSLALTVGLTFTGAPASVQTRGGVPALPPLDGPVLINTDAVARVRVVPVAGALSHP